MFALRIFHKLIIDRRVLDIYNDECLPSVWSSHFIHYLLYVCKPDDNKSFNMQIWKLYE